MTRPVTRPVIARDALGTLTKLGHGGQGIVYQAPKVKTKFADAMVFKEYQPQARAHVSFDALSAMPTLVEDTLSYHDGQALVSIAAWPCALVENGTGPVGFVMPTVPDSFYIDLTTVKGVSRTAAEFQHLLNPPSVLAARGITITDTQRYQLLREVAKTLAFLHRIGVCVGDISPKNLLFSLQPRPAVYFIDCDAMRINDVSVLPQTETPEWEVPAGEENLPLSIPTPTNSGYSPYACSPETNSLKTSSSCPPQRRNCCANSSPTPSQTNPTGGPCPKHGHTSSATPPKKPKTEHQRHQYQPH
jgi:serine/threonine protein kinase